MATYLLQDVSAVRGAHGRTQVIHRNLTILQLTVQILHYTLRIQNDKYASNLVKLVHNKLRKLVRIERFIRCTIGNLDSFERFDNRFQISNNLGIIILLQLILDRF
ncbi:hypothetical protein D3C84_656470 [compost metagenome]